MSVAPMQFIFAYNYLDNKDNRLQKKSNYFFLVQECKRQLFGGPSQPTKRLHALHAYVYTALPRGEESRFTASFYATLNAINDL